MEIYAIYANHDLRPIRKGVIRKCIGILLDDHPLFDDKRKDFISQYDIDEIGLSMAERLSEENPLLKQDFEELFV